MCRGVAVFDTDSGFRQCGESTGGSLLQLSIENEDWPAQAKWFGTDMGVWS
jgi:hypothetical protein